MPFTAQLLHLASRESAGVDAERDLQIAKDLKVGSLPRGLKMARHDKRNNSGWVTLLPGTELRPVSFNKLQQNENHFLQKHSWRAHVSPMFSSYTGNIVSSGSFCFQDANYAYATR